MYVRLKFKYKMDFGKNEVIHLIIIKVQHYT